MGRVCAAAAQEGFRVNFGLFHISPLIFLIVQTAMNTQVFTGADGECGQEENNKINSV